MNRRTVITLAATAAVAAGALAGCGTAAGASRSAHSATGGRSPQAAANLAIVNRAADLYNQRNWTTLAGLYAPNFTDHSARPGQKPGYQGFVDTTRMETVAFPDWHTHLDRVVADDTYVTELFTGTGTQTGPLEGLPATGRKVRITGTRTYRLHNGEITDTWLNDDELGLLTQLGMVHISAPGK